MRAARTLPVIENRVLLLGMLIALVLSIVACSYPAQESAAPVETQAVTAQVLRVTGSPAGPSTPSAESASATPAAKIVDGWQVYRSQGYDFELEYPQGGVLVDERLDSVRIDLPFEPGTNLQDKYLQIDIQEETAKCPSPMASGYSPAALDQAAVEIGGSSFVKQSGSEGAAGNYYNWTAYSTSRGDVCLSLTFVLHSLNPDNFETPLAEFDLPQESRSFEDIVATFEWLQ